MPDLARFFNLSHDIFCILDANGYYKKVNPAFIQLLGFEKEEFLSNKFTFFIHPDDAAETEQEYADVVSGKRNRVIENRFRKKSGGYCWLSWSSVVYGDEGLFYAVAHNITERKMLLEELKKEQENNQRKITAAVIQTQEKERAEISRELHDNINQILTTVKLYSELSREGVVDTKETMGKSISLLQTAINEIRKLSKQLSAVTIANSKLKDSVKDLVDTIAVTNLLSISLDAEGIEKLEVDKDIHLAVYRILQEHLTNILKHAKAKNVSVMLEFIDDMLILKVEDDGKGFDTSKKMDGIGILNMRTRAENLKGTLTIDSKPGSGSVLTAQIPLMK